MQPQRSIMPGWQRPLHIMKRPRFGPWALPARACTARTSGRGPSPLEHAPPALRAVGPPRSLTPRHIPVPQLPASLKSFPTISRTKAAHRKGPRPEALGSCSASLLFPVGAGHARDQYHREGPRPAALGNCSATVFSPYERAMPAINLTGRVHGPNRSVVAVVGSFWIFSTRGSSPGRSRALQLRAFTAIRSASNRDFPPAAHGGM